MHFRVDFLSHFACGRAHGFVHSKNKVISRHCVIKKLETQREEPLPLFVHPLEQK
jgi:hypothetical protein